LPRCANNAIALQTAQHRIERAFGRRQRLPLAERRRQLIAIVGVLIDEGEDAQLDDAAAGLGKPIAVHHHE
jgi:hypothetical protein